MLATLHTLCILANEDTCENNKKKHTVKHLLNSHLPHQLADFKQTQAEAIHI